MTSTTKCRIVARPWQTLYGDLNAIFLEQSLQSLLNHVCLHPGLRLEAVAGKFDPHLLPPNVYELLDLLEEIGCIELTYISKCPKMTVFGQAPPSEPGWLCSSHRVVDVPMISPIQLALFLKAVKRHCQAKELVDTAS